MADLHVICGLPGSGKTTLAKQLERDENALYLNADVTLKTLRGPGRGGDLDALRDQVEVVLETIALRVLELGTNVVVDNGYWARSQRAELRERAEAVGAAVKIYYLDVALGELWRRVQARNTDPANTSFHVEFDELRQWYEAIEPPQPGDDVIVVRPH